jgi:hypothetical protein
LKKTHHKKRADGVTQGVGPEFKPQCCKKKKKKRNWENMGWGVAQVVKQLPRKNKSSTSRAQCFSLTGLSGPIPNFISWVEREVKKA